MKKIFFVLSALTALCSCVKKEYDFPAGEPQDRTLYSSMEIALPEGVAFNAGASLDAWKLVNGGTRYVFTTKNGGNPATFNLPDSIPGVCQIGYLTYPSGIVDSLWRGEFFLSIPTVQKGFENAINPECWICAAHKSSPSTTLTPIVGALKFKINQADIASCTITSTAGNAVSGPVMVKMDENINFSKVANSSGYVEVSGGLKFGNEYYAAVLSDEYTSLDVVLRNSFGVSVWEKTIDIFDKLDKGGIIDLGEFGNPDISSLSLSMNSTEFEGYTVKKIVGYSEDRKRLFSGEVGETFSSGATLTAHIFGVEPGDFSASKLWFVVTMEDALGGTLVLPLKENGFVIDKAADVSFDLGTLSSSRNAAPWFCPEGDKRLLSGAGYAYGEANTFLIQCKTGSYSGTVVADPSIPESVTIDYRLRGEIFAGPSPEGVSFEWVQGYNNSTPAWDKYTMDRTNIYSCGKYSFSVDEANYTVTVKNTGAFAGSPILAMKKDGQVIWAWTFWNIAADGTTLRAVDFGGVKIANMDIGYCSEKISEVIPKIKFIRQSCNYYQWGRPIPTFSAQGAGISLGEGDSRNASKPRVPVVDCGATTVENALSHPGCIIMEPYTKGAASSELGDWLSDGLESNKDLWGGTTSDSVGVKSIYDPCPKGWRVPDAKTFLGVFPSPVVGYDLETYPSETTAGYQGVYVGGILFPTNGLITASTDKDGYVGQIAFTPKSNSTAKDASKFWTNTYYGGEDKNQCYVFKADYKFKKLDGTENADRTIGVVGAADTNALPVRCQLDEDNR